MMGCSLETDCSLHRKTHTPTPACMAPHTCLRPLHHVSQLSSACPCPALRRQRLSKDERNGGPLCACMQGSHHSVERARNTSAVSGMSLPEAWMACSRSCGVWHHGLVGEREANGILGPVADVCSGGAPNRADGQVHSPGGRGEGE